MPIYLFKGKNGEDVEKYFSYEDAPSIGTTILIDNNPCVRVASFVLDTAGIARKTHKYPYVSRSLCRNAEGCDTNKKGQPIIKSQAH